MVQTNANFKLDESRAPFRFEIWLQMTKEQRKNLYFTTITDFQKEAYKVELTGNERAIDFFPPEFS